MPFFSIHAFAEGEEEANEAQKSEDATASESTIDNKRVRHSQSIIGYQPITVAGQAIEATYLEETLGERYGAIILLQDQGEQLESNGVITPLRHALPEHGWSTLTLALDYPFEPNISLSVKSENDAEKIELPEIEEETDNNQLADKPTEKEQVNGDKTEQAANSLPPVSNSQRIDVALQTLQAKGIERVIFLGHGEGGNLAIELLDKITTPISALILVGSTALPDNETFSEFNFPVFDLYGAHDLDGVPAAVKHRKLTMKRLGNTGYESRRVIGADHLFSGLEPTLVVTVNGWLWKRFIKQDDN